MLQMLIAAPNSGSGKTTVTIALLAALKARGLNPCAFKSGPDYIDPMFHRSVLGVESHNLDLFFSKPQIVQNLYNKSAADHGAAICEGAMGYYDGLGGTSDIASAWHLADTLNLPVLLVLRPKGASLTLAAQVRGVMSFRTPHHIAGIILNDCKENLYRILAPMLEKETGVPVIGYLPPMPKAAIESRHLGLKTAGEIENLQKKITLLHETMEKTVDFEKLFSVFACPAPKVPKEEFPIPNVRIAVARDEAFCFTYTETLEAFKEAGAEPIFFSPLHDKSLPQNIGGLYLPGGYPELCAKALSENTEMLLCIKTAIKNSLPTVAECGGFLYLGQTLEDVNGDKYRMAGVLPGEGFKVGHLVRFGYATLTAKENSMLLKKDELLPVHEFHHWDSTENGIACTATKPNGRTWDCAFANEYFYAGFPHLYWAGTPLPQRFADAARRYMRDKI